MTETPRQTLGYLRDLFEARGLRPKSKLGQSFLIDLNLLDLIVRCAELSRRDLVLEVGSGTGSLTAKLAEQAGMVLGVELDPGFYELARENTAAFPNVILLQCDILERKHAIHPQVLQKLRIIRGEAAADSRSLTQLKLVANLPYVVATPVIANLLLGELPFERMVVTIQWELGERLAAAPSTKDFGALSVLVQSLADVEVIRRLPPQAFWPRPKVDSAIVRIRPNAQKRSRIENLPSFHAFVRDLYLHRRKNLRGALLPSHRRRFSKQQLDQLLQEQGFDAAGRAEALTVEQHVALWKALAQK